MAYVLIYILFYVWVSVYSISYGIYEYKRGNTPALFGIILLDAAILAVGGIF